MEPFDPSMFPHSVYLLAETDGSDRTASVVEGFPATSGLTPLPCRVRLSGSYTIIVAEVETTITKAQVCFPADPGAKKNDRFQRTTDGLRVRVLAPARARDGDGVLFVATCEVID